MKPIHKRNFIKVKLEMEAKGWKASFSIPLKRKQIMPVVMREDLRKKLIANVLKFCGTKCPDKEVEIWDYAAGKPIEIVEADIRDLSFYEKEWDAFMASEIARERDREKGVAVETRKGSRSKTPMGNPKSDNRKHRQRSNRSVSGSGKRLDRRIS